MDSTTETKKQSKLNVTKLVIGILLILSQVIRQPGFGFYTGEGYSNQVLGYDLFAAGMYIAGVWLIYRGLRPKEK
jgi:hypothetical protein